MTDRARASASHDSQLQRALASAAAALQAGNPASAESTCRAILRKRPREPEALHLHALVAWARGDLATARARLRKALRASPKTAKYHNSLGLVLRQQGDVQAAEAAHRQAIELREPFPAAWYNLGLAREDLGDFEGALAAYTTAVQQNPAYASAEHAKGLVLQTLGRLEEACAAYERALELQPAYPEAWFHLAHAQAPEAASEAQVEAVNGLLDARSWPARETSWLYFTLGKLGDDLGRYDEAFAAYRRANELAKPHYDPDAHTRWVERLIETHDDAGMRLAGEVGVGSRQPVYIVGMPRSGTTLVEQILAAHPEVQARGELREVPQLARRIAEDTNTRFPDALAEASQDRLRAWAYELATGHTAVAPTAVRVTDKLPDNFWYLGLIGLLLPQAPIVICWRDPRDVALSCYFHRFERGQAFSYDLYHCGRRLRDFRRLLSHWLQVLPNPVLVLDYERLVREPEPAIGELLAHCGLEWDAACLQHSAQSTVVTTASSRQVREPIHERALGRWHRYEQHIQPLLEGLGSLDFEPPHAGE